MAYLQFSELPSAPAGEVANRFAPRLDALERNVLRLSFADPRSSIVDAGRLTQFTAWLSGRRRKPGLADERLEALRRYAVLYRLDGASLAPAEEMALSEKGFSYDLVHEVRRIVDRHLADQVHQPKALIKALPWFAVAAGALGGLVLFLQQITEDITISAIIASLIGVTAASLHHAAPQA